MLCPFWLIVVFLYSKMRHFLWFHSEIFYKSTIRNQLAFGPNVQGLWTAFTEEHFPYFVLCSSIHSSPAEESSARNLLRKRKLAPTLHTLEISMPSLIQGERTLLTIRVYSTHVKTAQLTERTEFWVLWEDGCLIHSSILPNEVFVSPFWASLR